MEEIKDRKGNVLYTVEADEVNDPDLKELLESRLFKRVANKFHKAWECGEV